MNDDHFHSFWFSGKLYILKPPYITVKCEGKKKSREKIHNTERWNKTKWHGYLLAKEYYLSYWRLSLDGYKQLSPEFLQGRGQQICYIMHRVLLWQGLLSTRD